MPAPAKTSAAIAPKKKVTFTVKAAPTREADKKTIARLMRMQRPIQSGLRRLSKRRQRDLNWTSPRAGRTWTSRVRPTKLVRVAKGETFTLTITPQIIPDIARVEKYLDVKAG